VTQVHAVYNDTLASLPLGKLQVERASNVEFNEATQEWEAKYPDGRLMHTGKSRDDVIMREVETITQEIEKTLLNKLV